ncbi:ABC transporter substrate-binding protein [Bordetella genomosp. 10]|uniref:ABC transporter substrate-binding protein n=1 Tax=Bordetella genomosp. 10 TaxID=1416804 RepID=A0A261S4Z4_9BORD|nr:PhnD/SsuA/transferrin family substrate-binding protein [Bordetella genomosp. 10]OZI32429.1 ABC transporter substrate-binding protein [Bordetella genomosp. 10]
MPAAPLITSTRMYDAAPAARAAWHALLGEGHRRAGLRVAFVEHGWPTPIGELWQRPGLCGAFMCGWPYARALRAGRAYAAVAAVAPAWPAYGDLARYRSEFLVREDTGWTRVEDALGSRYGWMVRDSQSGWNAPRRRLAAIARERGECGERGGRDGGDGGDPRLFQESKGPYGNPRGLLQALRQGEIDLTALDGWYLDLLRAHDPAALAGIRTVGWTDWTPNPLLVSGPDVDPETTSRLSRVLLAMHEDAGGALLLRQAHVARFVAADPKSYEVLLDDEDAGHYPEIR